jgi:large subunit ribosomal protein L24
MKATVISSKISKKPFSFQTSLKVGDAVMVVAGGNKKSGKNLKGQVGTLKKIFPKTSRVIVENLNMVSRHKKASNSQEQSGIIKKEGSIHISNVMFYSDKLKRPVRLKNQLTSDGSKSRGFLNPETKSFEVID